MTRLEQAQEAWERALAADRAARAVLMAAEAAEESAQAAAHAAWDNLQRIKQEEGK